MSNCLFFAWQQIYKEIETCHNYRTNNLHWVSHNFHITMSCRPTCLSFHPPLLTFKPPPLFFTSRSQSHSHCFFPSHFHCWMLVSFIVLHVPYSIVSLFLFSHNIISEVMSRQGIYRSQNLSSPKQKQKNKEWYLLLGVSHVSVTTRSFISSFFFFYLSPPCTVPTFWQRTHHHPTFFSFLIAMCTSHIWTVLRTKYTCPSNKTCYLFI